MIMLSTGFSHGVVHFWHMCQKIFLPISLVCQRCPVLVFFLNVIYLKWCRLTALMPPKKFWHTCVKNFLACFCVSEILTHRNRPHKKFATFFGGTTLALSHFLLSLSLSICGLLAPLPRSYAPIAHPSFFDVSSHVLHINLPVIPSPSPAHISPLSYRLMLRFFKPTQLPEVEPPDTCEPSPLEVVADSLIHGPSSGLCVQGEHEDIELRDKKRKKSAQATFAYQIKNLTGLDIVPAEDKNGRRCSLCKTCGAITLRNQTARWQSHAKICSGLKATRAPLSAAARRLVVQCTAGGERHLQKLCDGYIVAFWLYKHKLPFAMGPKIHEVILC
jgi:hypothetical protein